MPSKSDTQMILDAIQGVRARLDALEAPTQAPTPTPIRTPTHDTPTRLPESPELLALQGQCRPSAQRIVQRHAKAGAEEMAEYIGKLAEFQAPGRPSARFQYACAMLDAIENAPVRTAKAKPALPRFNTGLSEKSAELLARAFIPTKAQASTPKRMKAPTSEADLSVWNAFIVATTDTRGIKASAIRTRAWRAREKAAGRDPYRSAS